MNTSLKFDTDDWIRDNVYSHVLHLPIITVAVAVACAAIRLFENDSYHYALSFVLYFLIVLLFSIRGVKYKQDYENMIFDYINARKFEHFCGDESVVGKKELPSVERYLYAAIERNLKRNEVTFGCFVSALFFWAPSFNLFLNNSLS